MIFLTGTVPLFFAILALSTGRYLYKALVTSSILLILTAYITLSGNNMSYFILAGALACSILGDYFLSFKEKNKNHYIRGILVFFAAHGFYLAYMLVKGVMHLPALLILVGVFGLYFILRMKKGIKERAMLYAVLAYLLISCFTLAASLGLEVDPTAKALLVSAIALIMFSDIMIAETDFMGNKMTGEWILPSYYLAHILILFAGFLV
ncbi:MAG: lysoplasmalogenase family protein [Clostridia bacterium]